MSRRLPQVLRQWALKVRHRHQPSSAANGTNVWKTAARPQSGPPPSPPLRCNIPVRCGSRNHLNL